MAKNPAAPTGPAASPTGDPYDDTVQDTPDSSSPVDDSAPTAWFLKPFSATEAPPGAAGAARAAAKGYWPNSTLVEVWNPSLPAWTPRRILEDLSDGDWETSTQADVEAWIASTGKATKPGG